MSMSLQEMLLLIPAVLVSLTLHELAHGYVALKLGDPTAKDAGRLTFNPLAHLDPIGTLMFFFVKMGWAKPVPVNPAYFQDPVRDMAKVAVAGPAANLLQAIAGSFALKAALWPETVQIFLFLFVYINVALAIFNLLPIPPLDGSRIVPLFLSGQQLLLFERFMPYGMLILIGAFYFGLLDAVLTPPIRFVVNILL